MQKIKAAEITADKIKSSFLLGSFALRASIKNKLPERDNAMSSNIITNIIHLLEESILRNFKNEKLRVKFLFKNLQIRDNSEYIR